MSLLRKSETKQVETKTQKVSTPPKYFQSMSSKGVRSTSYVHRTFVDAEPKTPTVKKPPANQEQIVDAKAMPGAVGANPRVDSVKKGVSKVNNNQTFYTLNKGVTKMYKKLPGKKSKLVFDSSKTSTAQTEPTAKTTKTTAPKQTEGKTEGDSKEAAQTEEELLQKKYEIFRKLLGELVTTDFNPTKKLGNVMLTLKNNDEPEIKQMLKNLNAIITISATVGEERINGESLALLVAKLKSDDKSISFKEMKSALRNNANPKKGKVVYMKQFSKLRQDIFEAMHFKSFQELFDNMDKDEDGEVSVPEFANMYIRAKLTQAMEKDINDNFIDETYTEMLKLFGIGDETATVDNDEVVPVDTPSKKTTVDNNNGAPAPPRKRESDPDKAKAKKIQQEQAKQARLEEERAAKENQKRKKEEETKKIEDDQKFIVKLKGGTFSVEPNSAYKNYKKKLNNIPKTACKPETTTNN